MNKTINVAYSCNEFYIQHTGISMISLLENNRNVIDLCIYFISLDVSDESISELRSIVERYDNARIVIIPFEQICSNLKISNVGRHIETIYAKLFFANIKEVDKIFYLDSDVIVNGSIKELWDLDLELYFFGCVKTITKDYCKALRLSESEDFFNDGVALVNTKALRNENMEEKFLKFISDYNGNPPVLSEGTINVVCKGRIKAIHPKYNLYSGFLMFTNSDLKRIAHQPVDFYSDVELNEARDSPIVIHYLTGWFKRPWETGCTHPLKHKYECYKLNSPWKNVPLQPKSLPFRLKVLKFIFRLFPVNLILLVRKFFYNIK